MLAAALLAAGLLWQNNVLGIFKSNPSGHSGGKEEPTIPIKREPAPSAGLAAHAGDVKPAAREVQEKTLQPAVHIKVVDQVKQEGAETPAAKAPAAAEKQEPALQPDGQAAAEKALQETRSPAPAAEPAAENGTVSAPISEGEYPYSIYLGSLKTLEQAKRAISVYSRKGINACWVRVMFKEKGEWYRIYAGHFKDRQEAEAFAQAHGISEKETLKTEYANLIGAYSQPKDFDDTVKAISDLGYSSYAVKGSDGKLKLLVGAYVTEEAAEQQRQDLMAKGIENRVIKR